MRVRVTRKFSMACGKYVAGCRRLFPIHGLAAILNSKFEIRNSKYWLALCLTGCAPLHEPFLNAAGDQVKRGATAGRVFAASTFHTVDVPYLHVSAGPPPSAEFSLWHIVNNPPPAFLSGTGPAAIETGPVIK